MIFAFAMVVMACALIVSGWSFVLAIRNKAPQGSLLIGLAALEVLLLAQLIVGLVLLLMGERPGSLATFLAYLIGSLIVLPLGAAWALAERTRSSTAILGIACLAVPVMTLRLLAVWQGAHA